MGGTWKIGGVALDFLCVIDVDDLLGVALDEAVHEQSHKGSSHDDEEYQAKNISAASILILHDHLLLVHEKWLSELGAHLFAQLVHLRINYIN